MLNCYIKYVKYYVIVLNTLKFISSALFATHILPDGSSAVLQSPTHCSKWTLSGWKWSLPWVKPISVVV